MDNQKFKQLSISRREIEKFLLDSNGNIAVRVALASSGEAGAVNIDQVGGDDISSLGTQKALPTAIFDDEGNQITSFGSPSTIAEYKSPNDFSATFVSSTIIAISQLQGFEIIDSSQIVYVRVIHANSTSEVFTNGSGGVTLEYETGSITIVGAGTPFTSGDVFEVGINSQKKGYDSNSQSNLVSVINRGVFPPTSTESRTITTTTINTPIVEEIILNNIHRNKMIHIGTDGNVTAKVYMTLDPDADAADLTTGWVEITATKFGASPIAISSDVIATLNNEMPDRLAIEVTDGGTLGSASVHIKQF